MITPKKVQVGYDPEYKFCLVWDVLCHNINAFIERASLDICGNETSDTFAGFSEIISNISGSLHNTPGLRKFKETTVFTDSLTVIPRICIHSHKHHPMGDVFIRQVPH